MPRVGLTLAYPSLVRLIAVANSTVQTKLTELNMLKSAYNILIAASVALMMFGFVSQADAQRGGGGVRGGREQTNELSLLSNEKIQEELELVDDQVEEIKELGDEMRASMREMFSGLRESMSDATNEERREMWGGMQEEMQTRYKELQPKIESVLLPAQVQRLAEIKLQATVRRSGGLTSERGSQALKEQLDISDEQLEAMKEKAEKVRESLATKIEKLRKEAEAEVLSVLDTEQREKYEELMGETYDIDGLYQRGGGGDAGGRGGDRGGRGGDRGGRGSDRGGRGGDRGGRGGDRGGNGDSEEAN